MKIHELKTWQPYFNEVMDGNKTFELRKNDRNFMKGDYLLLREFSIDKGYTDKDILAKITYILEGGNFGLDKGFVVLGLKILNVNEV